uniref:Uncharacterized protein n=1 Tax=Anguilla anguilla TaxID=7936 RepID=A0A0E9Q1L4_ANGAN
MVQLQGTGHSYRVQDVATAYSYRI